MKKWANGLWALAILLWLTPTLHPQTITQPLTPPLDRVPDRFAPVSPSAVKLSGWLGDRVRKNIQARLLTKNEDEMLDGFKQRPGKQAMIGEHVGKWLHAATLAWVYTGDPALRAKLDRVVAALLATQQPDGYLGTYVADAHWAMGREQKWDVWVHKYNLIGLLTSATYTGDRAALEAARRIGDLLVGTFGRGAALNLNERSTHHGLASGSVIEPMVLLYRATGDARYLDFARFIVERWEEPTGPKIVGTLTAQRSVKLIADAKADEMLSCLTGLLELYRATGEVRYYLPARAAWDDIVTHQLLLTGSASSGEYWTEPRRFPTAGDDKVGDTCVTVSWIQFNQQLLRLTGEARFADELEKTFYNHLAAAQHPDGAAWCYFTAHDGRKPYKTDQNSAASSGPQAWALLPTFAYQTSDDGVVVNFFAPGTALLKLKNGEPVTIRQETDYPVAGRVTLSVTVPKPLKFALRVRVPAWSNLMGVKATPGEYWLLRQTWSGTQTLTLDFALPVRLVSGTGANAGRVAVVRGPQVLALDEQFNPDATPLAALAFARPPQLKISARLRDADGRPVYEADGVFAQAVNGHSVGERVTLRLTPFAAAGATGLPFAVWPAGPIM